MSEHEKGASPSCRYFYTDPLAAAWMAMHFGMCFRAVNQANGDYWPGEVGWQRILLEHNSYDRYYIKVDSLHLLEPRVGDLVFECGDYYVAESQRHPEFIMSLTNFSKSATVIQRDGKPFFWPESEPV